MSIKLGLVGVGNHGRMIANLCMAEGAEIAAYDRHKADIVYGFGKRMHWEEMTSKGSELDGVLAMADPETTLKVVSKAIKNGMPVLATKPLMIENIDLLSEVRAPLRVDHWRLWSPKYQRLATKFREDSLSIKGIKIKAYGNGPKRDFSGLFDYGWHALAFVFHLLGIASNTNDEMSIRSVEVLSTADRRQLFKINLGWKHWPGSSNIHGMPVEIITGNGADEKKFEVEVEFKDGTDKIEWPHPKDVGLQNMVSSFLRDINGWSRDNHTGSVANSKELFLSYEINRGLNKILQAAFDSQ